MKQDDNILDKLNRNDGMTVPEGYFADFARRMEAELPMRPELLNPMESQPRTWWQRLRPYAYMAAMFAGVWCMLKMFTMLTSTSLQPLETNPTMADAFSNDTFVNEYVIPDVNQWALYDSLMYEGLTPESLLDTAEMFMVADPIPSDINE